MNNENQAAEYHSHNIAGAIGGFLIGGLAGAGAMLLLAPQSGARTRQLIQEKGIELRDETTSMIDAALAKAWLKKNKITRNTRRKVKELIHHGKDLVKDQVEHVTKITKTLKKSYLNS